MAQIGSICCFAVTLPSGEQTILRPGQSMYSVAADGWVNRDNSTSLEGELGESSYTFCLGFLAGAGSSFLLLSDGNVAVAGGSRDALGHGRPYAPYISLTAPRPSSKSRLSQSPSSLYTTGTTFNEHTLCPLGVPEHIATGP